MIFREFFIFFTEWLKNATSNNYKAILDLKSYTFPSIQSSFANGLKIINVQNHIMNCIFIRIDLLQYYYQI